MMSSTAWTRRVLLPATLHSAIGTVLCRCVTRPAAVADAGFQPPCSPELLNHSAL
jgi:hypothetical protein